MLPAMKRFFKCSYLLKTRRDQHGFLILKFIMDKERNGGFEKMAGIGGWLISVCSIGSGSGIGLRLPRIDCNGAKPIRAITSMPRA